MPGKGSNNGGKKNGGGSKQGKGKAGNGGRRVTRGYRGITQSVAVSVNQPFGDTAKPQTVVKGLNAFDSSHVPLPRAVGDYTVIRSTEVFTGSEKFHVLGPMKVNSLGGDAWTNFCCQSANNINAAVGASSNTKRTNFSAMQTDSWKEARLTPAAFSVKLMNPEALQTTSGIIYVGRTKQMLNCGGSARTYANLANELVSYSSPELCAAGRLALRGVEVDAVPYDMNSMAEFRPLAQISTTGSDANVTWANDSVMYDGFAPIFVYNPNGIALQFMVCCEWRVRFDPSNPAYASHTYHRPSTPGYWDRVQRISSALGNGVMDLAEKSAPQIMMNMAEKAVKRQFMIAGG